MADTDSTPRVEYRVEPANGRTSVWRYEDGVQVGSSIMSGTRAQAGRVAQELNVAIATGVRLATDHRA